MVILSDQWNEAHGAKLLSGQASIACLRQSDEFLSAVAVTNRHHQPSAGRQLIDKRLRHAAAGCSRKNRVIGRRVRPTVGAVPLDDEDIVVAQPAHPLARQAGKFRLAFDRDDFARDLRKHGCRISGAGADFEHPVPMPHSGSLDHQRDDVRLGDRLSRFDRERVIAIGSVRIFGVYELLPWNASECLQQCSVNDAPARDLLADHALALTGKVWHNACGNNGLRRGGVPMAGTDAAFAGSIPQIYDRHLGPLLFEPYADELARRAAELRPTRILETAAGTGIVTEALQRACPEAEIVATDLNQGMLDVGATRIQSDKVIFLAADAQQLPFDADGFDLVVCQFGVMFYPDRVQANLEARRVLKPGGRYLLAIWDRLDRNPASHLVHRSVAQVFPEDPPQFLARAPFGYSDPAAIEHDLLEAGFRDIEFQTVALQSRPSATPHDAAFGLVYGSPLRAEIEQRSSDGLDRAAAAAEDTLNAGPFDRSLSAHIVTAIA